MLGFSDGATDSSFEDSYIACLQNDIVSVVRFSKIVERFSLTNLKQITKIF